MQPASVPRRELGLGDDEVPSGCVDPLVSAILGMLAPVGIPIRDSVILIVQIEDLGRAGVPPWRAVVEATEHRMRPILLTAAAATLAPIPISRDVFRAPMTAGSNGARVKTSRTIGSKCASGRIG